MNASVVLVTVAFGLLVAGIILCLGLFMLGLDVRTALIAAGVLGFTQSAGGLYYIHRRFKYQGPPPRGGGTMG